MTEINPYLQATANLANAAAKDGEDAAIKGSLDRFIDKFARFMAWQSYTSGVHYMDYALFDALRVDEFAMMCMGYGVYQAHIGPTARDWFVTNYKTYYTKFEGWEPSDADVL